MELTREIYEQVLSEYNENVGCGKGFLGADQKTFLDTKFPPNREGWFYNPNTKFLKFFTPNKHWGWNGSGTWIVLDLEPSRIDFRNLKPAPKKLVIERVKEELIKRGYVEGAEVGTLFTRFIGRKFFVANGEHPQFKKSLMTKGQIWLSGEPLNPLVMSEGEWTEIIDTKKEKIEDLENQLRRLLEEVEELKNS